MFRRKLKDSLSTSGYRICAVLKIDAKTNRILESVFIDNKKEAIDYFQSIKRNWEDWDNNKRITDNKCPLDKKHPFHKKSFLGDIPSNCFLTPNNKYYYILCDDIIVF